MEVIEINENQVKLLDVIGSDKDIAQRARICTKGEIGIETEMTQDEVKRLIQQLITRNHTSPFEFAGITIQVKCPIFIARQWFRHRTFRYLERSGRYYGNTDEVYLPEKMRTPEYLDAVETIFDQYQKLLNSGVSKQEARIILPLGTYTEFVVQMDMNNLLHFLELRLSSAAQPEMRQYARFVADIVRDKFPITYCYFVKRQ